MLKTMGWSLFLLLCTTAAMAQDNELPEDSYTYPDPVAKDLPHEWQGAMAPGGGYLVYRPQAIDSMGLFHGPFFKFILFQHSGEAYRGPGVFQFYAQMQLLNSTNMAQRDLLMYSFGTHLSFESNTKRIAGIPFFGLEMGGMHQSGRRKGAFHITPKLGLHILATRHVDWYIVGGYTVATRYFDEWSGVYGAMGVHVQFW